MQPKRERKTMKLVVFTFQKEGRCNHQQQFSKHLTLFLPFKKKADATQRFRTVYLLLLFLPFKKKADATTGN